MCLNPGVANASCAVATHAHTTALSTRSRYWFVFHHPTHTPRPFPQHVVSFDRACYSLHTVLTSRHARIHIAWQGRIHDGVWPTRARMNDYHGVEARSFWRSNILPVRREPSAHGGDKDFVAADHVPVVDVSYHCVKSRHTFPSRPFGPNVFGRLVRGVSCVPIHGVARVGINQAWPERLIHGVFVIENQIYESRGRGGGPETDGIKPQSKPHQNPMTPRLTGERKND